MVPERLPMTSRSGGEATNFLSSVQPWDGSPLSKLEFCAEFHHPSLRCAGRISPERPVRGVHGADRRNVQDVEGLDASIEPHATYLKSLGQPKIDLIQP